MKKGFNSADRKCRLVVENEMATDTVTDKEHN